MSNNDLPCENCGGQHHPVECLKEESAEKPKKSLKEKITKLQDTVLEKDAFGL